MEQNHTQEVSNVFTAQELYLRNLKAKSLIAVEAYLTNSLLDWIQLSAQSNTARVISDQRDMVAAEMRRRGLPLSMASQMAERRKLFPKQQAIAA